MIWLAIPAIAATGYYCLALIAAACWRPGSRPGAPAPAVSILKPVHGRDPRFYEAILSHARQEYPEFEILFGVGSSSDASLQDIEQLKREFPALRIEVVVVRTNAPNAKVGVLKELARRARHDVLLVNDSDIVVEAGYLRAVTSPLQDAGVGLVTCLYRAGAESWASRAEALGIATEFAPSVLVARLLGVAEFALGSTMVFRRAVLAEIGGFAAIANYLADDYQLGCRISRLGKRIVFAPVVVETNLGGATWGETWRHQLRWSRTIRVSRASGYYGYVVTHATLWGLVALAAGHWAAGSVALLVRVVAGIWIGAGTLRDRKVKHDFWMIPLRDLFGFGVWVAGLFGDTVQWRDKRLKLRPDGRILD